ncbi:hypothetical protein K438DRAFT_1965140 [Mycena galopus ATCC 62051]|nr:hypothetical protein K438DRAFT_1965140 [Mycena galopus ATCC 62051]
MFQPTFASVNLAGVILMTQFYGMYLILFISSTYLLFRHSKGQYTVLMKSTMFISTIALFLSVSGDWAVTVRRSFEGFIYFRDGAAANIYFISDSQASGTIGIVFVALSLCLTDFIIVSLRSSASFHLAKNVTVATFGQIYRLWVVWSHNRVVIVLPAMCFLGLAGSLISTTIFGGTNVPADQNWTIVANIAFIIVWASRTNAYCSVFIAWKVWETAREISPLGGIDLMARHFARLLPYFVAIVVESAAIYTAWMIFLCVTHGLNSNLQIVFLSCLPTVGGITNALIYVRIALGATVEQRSKQGGQSTSIVTAPIEFVPFHSAILRPRDTESMTIINMDKREEV